MKLSNQKNISHVSEKTEFTLETNEESQNHSFHSSGSELIIVGESINIVADALVDQQNRSFHFFEYDSDEISSERIICPYHFDPINEPEIILECSYSWETKNTHLAPNEGKSSCLDDSLCPQSNFDADPFFLRELEPLGDLSNDSPQENEDQGPIKDLNKQNTSGNEHFQFLSEPSHSSETHLHFAFDSLSEITVRNSVESFYHEVTGQFSNFDHVCKLCREGIEAISSYLWSDCGHFEKVPYRCDDKFCRVLLDNISQKREKLPNLRNEQLIKKVLNFCIKHMLKEFRKTHFQVKSVKSSTIKQKFVERFINDFQPFGQVLRPGFRKASDCESDFLTYNSNYFKKIAGFPLFRKELLSAIGKFEQSIENIFHKELRDFLAVTLDWVDSAAAVSEERAVWLYFNGKERLKADKLIKIPWSQSQYHSAIAVVRSRISEFPPKE
jgi:hypothetical protein